MGSLKPINKCVEEVLQHYPLPAQQRIKELRTLIFETANSQRPVIKIEETLKWGEPSYLCKGGSTIRIAWHERHPDEYGIYLNCKTSLIQTIRELYSDTLYCEGNRAIRLPLEKPIPRQTLCHVILLALTYHRIKHLPLLGA